jgi:pathogenesis-related protein 1
MIGLVALLSLGLAAQVIPDTTSDIFPASTTTLAYPVGRGKCHRKHRTSTASTTTSYAVPTISLEPVPKPTKEEKPTKQPEYKKPVGSASGADAGCLNAHNLARSAAGLPTFRWSASLESTANTYAQILNERGSLVHSNGPYGENLFFGSSSCMAAVAMWTAERYNYNGQSIGAGNFGKYGHFSQIMYPAVKEVGCGSSGGYVVCHYDQTQISGTRLSKY